MRRAILLIALLGLAACSDDDTPTADSSSDSPAEQVADRHANSMHYTARLTCETSGASNNVYVCLANNGESISPVKITSGTNTKIYSNIQDFTERQVDFPINGNDFSIAAQNGSCTGCILRLEILDSSGAVVGSDEADAYGFVALSS